MPRTLFDIPAGRRVTIQTGGLTFHDRDRTMGVKRTDVLTLTLTDEYREVGGKTCRRGVDVEPAIPSNDLWLPDFECGPADPDPISPADLEAGRALVAEYEAEGGGRRD